MGWLTKRGPGLDVTSHASRLCLEKAVHSGGLMAPYADTSLSFSSAFQAHKQEVETPLLPVHAGKAPFAESASRSPAWEQWREMGQMTLL